MEHTKLNFNKGNSEICRLSWFLVEVNVVADDHQLKSKLKKRFCIIHFVDIVDEDSSNMYINRVVNFKCNQNIVQGKIIMASDDRLHVAKELSALVEECEDAETLAIENERRFLVQYTKGPNNLFHSVVQQKEICWPVVDVAKQKEVFIKDGRLQRVATVLYAHEDAQRIFTELESLKNRCFDMTFDESDDSEKSVDNDIWLLVQYSHGPAVIVYAVVNMQETVWQEENLYKDVVAYLSDGVSIFQGIIMRKSKSRDVLDQELRKIKEFSSAVPFPMEPEISVKLEPAFSATCLKAEQENDAVVTLQNRVEQMESRMYHESAMIANAFEAIDQTRRTMNRRLYLLQNALN